MVVVMVEGGGGGGSESRVSDFFYNFTKNPNLIKKKQLFFCGGWRGRGLE